VTLADQIARERIVPQRERCTGAAENGLLVRDQPGQPNAVNRRPRRARLLDPLRGQLCRTAGRIARLVAADVPIIYLFNADYLYAYRRQLRGFGPNAFLPTWNAAEWRL